MLSLWVSAEPAGEEVAVGKGPQQLWVKLEKEENHCGWWGWLSPTQLPVLLGSCGWYRGTRMAPKNPRAQRRPFPTSCSSCKVKRGFCNTVFLPCNLLTPLGLVLPDYGIFVPVEKHKGAVDSPAGLDGFRGEAASDVGFARAGERLFAAMRVHWVLVHGAFCIQDKQASPSPLLFIIFSLSSLLYLLLPPAPFMFGKVFAFIILFLWQLEIMPRICI